MPKSKSEVEQVMKPWFPVFWECAMGGFERYFKTHANELGAIPERTKSSYINDMIVDNLRQALQDAPNMGWQNRYGQTRLWIEGSLCVRFKKLNRDLRPNSSPTQASFDFYSHSIETPVQFRFPDMSSPTCLFLGYAANKTKTAPAALCIVCPKKMVKGGKTGKGKIEIEWVLPISKPDNIPIISAHPVAKEEAFVPQVVTKNGARKKNSTSEK